MSVIFGSKIWVARVDFFLNPHLCYSYFRANDVVARYGGEEFCVMLTETTLEQASAWADRMLDAIRALRIPHAESDLHAVSVNVGVASMAPQIGGHDDNPSRVTLLADQAPYQSKREGRNRVTCSKQDRILAAVSSQ